MANITSNTAVDLDGFTPGREVMVKVSGTFDNATFVVQTQDNGTDWVAYPGVSMTAAGAQVLVTPTSTIRVQATGGGASLDIDAIVQELRD